MLIKRTLPNLLVTGRNRQVKLRTFLSIMTTSTAHGTASQRRAAATRHKHGADHHQRGNMRFCAAQGRFHANSTQRRPRTASCSQPSRPPLTASPRSPCEPAPSAAAPCGPTRAAKLMAPKLAHHATTCRRPDGRSSAAAEHGEGAAGRTEHVSSRRRHRHLR